jgi:hypothetical protein
MWREMRDQGKPKKERERAAAFHKLLRYGFKYFHNGARAGLGLMRPAQSGLL